MTLQVITLVDETSGATARVLPGLGFNCYSFRPVVADEPIEVLWADPEYTSGDKKPAGSGIPLLFPFAGRIRGTSFRFQGREYALEAGDGRGNAIHGFVFKRPWRVIEQTSREVTGQFQASIDDPSLLDRWPADFRITVRYTLQGNVFSTDIQVENPDECVLPFGLGTHGYFRVPLGRHGKAADCRIKVPVRDNWELVGLIPTGRRLPAEVGEKLSAGLPFSESQLDNVFDGLMFQNHRCEASVHDPGSGRALKIAFDDKFRACVVFNPPHREAICIEPYTTIPDPFTLQEMGVDPGLQVLAAGQSFHASIEIRLD